MDENSLTHYGVLGMKWGRRKSKASKGSNSKSSSKKSSKKTSNVKKTNKVLTDSRKQTLKSIAKTTAKVAGAVAATTLLGYAGSMAYSEFSRLANEYHQAQSQRSAADALNKALTGDFSGAKESAAKSNSEYLKTDQGKALKEEWEKWTKKK